MIKEKLFLEDSKHAQNNKTVAIVKLDTTFGLTLLQSAAYFKPYLSETNKKINNVSQPVFEFMFSFHIDTKDVHQLHYLTS